jgi:hypothetical protein
MKQNLWISISRLRYIRIHIINKIQMQYLNMDRKYPVKKIKKIKILEKKKDKRRI